MFSAPRAPSAVNYVDEDLRPLSSGRNMGHGWSSDEGNHKWALGFPRISNHTGRREEPMLLPTDRGLFSYLATISMRVLDRGAYE
jgi:hypothetical protein